MCGITAIISKNNTNIIDFLLNSIHQLENRGYDSVGISYISQTIRLYKKAMLNGYDFIKFKEDCSNISSYIGIAHTRWATHGGVTDENAHPHLSYNNLICVVHNGIIENYYAIKKELIEKGIYFKSDTDTEIICNLLEHYIVNLNLDILDAIKMLITKIQGTYGLVILYKDNPDNLYVIRNGSPILIGENEKEIIVTSEISGFMKQVNNYICLENNDIAILNKQGINTINKYVKNNIQNEIYNSLTPTPYSHWMLKEIYEQPESILRSMNNGARIADNYIKLGGINYLKEYLNNIENIILLGCGTSLNACMIGKYYFKLCSKITNIQCIDGANFAISDIPKNKYTLIIFCSQSGETKDLYRCLELCENINNIITLGIINAVDSLIAREVHCGVYLNSGREVSVASTKSFTSMLCILSMISIWINQQQKITQPLYNLIINNMRKLPQDINELFNRLKNLQNIDNIINKLDKNSLFILGKGKMEAIANEGALKIKEVCYIHAEGFSSNSLKHGPFALLCKEFPVILLINKKNKNKLLNTYKEIVSRGSYVLILTEINDITDYIDIGTNDIIYVPENKYYEEILYTITMQYLSYNLSIHKGINPDKPKNLAKVVTVE